MGAKDNTARDEGETTIATLGDVLYTAKPRTLVLETEWVSLVEAIAAGDQRALHSLYDRTHRIVFTLAVRITNNRETAEEVTLDVFHDVWRRASTYDAGNGTVVGWIMNQAQSRAIDRLRLEQRKKRVNPYPDEPQATSAANDPHQTFELGESRIALRNALTCLTPQERLAIETAFFSELTYSEAAARLNEAVGTVKTRIRSGLGKLRDALKENGKP
jgi:RNA polymerase sigma-70 factor, ECF subfamily